MKIIWVEASSVRQSGWPEFDEVTVTGGLQAAIDRVKELATDARFMLGQVLDSDGAVLATVAPQGIVHCSSEPRNLPASLN